MIDIKDIRYVVDLLHDVVWEKDASIRKAVLQDTLRMLKQHDKGSYDLLCLVLSFQLHKIIRAHDPAFNMIPFTDFKDHFATYLESPIKTTWTQLPYEAQLLIRFMASTASINLRSTTIISLAEFTYIDPFEWLIKNVDIRDHDSNLCSLCKAGPQVEGSLCASCIKRITGFTEYQCDNFTIILTQEVMGGVQVFSGAGIDLVYGAYEISSTGTTTISYTIRTGSDCRVQLQLPFKEYQRI